METFASRLKQFIETQGMSSTQFADTCGIPRPSLSQILSGRNKKISDILIGAIHSVFPNLNVVWLMFGEGTMFVRDNKNDEPLHNNEFATNPLTFNLDLPAPINGKISDTESQPQNPLPPQHTEFDIMPDNEGSNPFVNISQETGSALAPRNTGGGDKMRLQNSVKSDGLSNVSTKSKENGLTTPQNRHSSRMNTEISADFKIADLQSQIDEMRKNLRRVTHITVYYDDSTFETFVPKGR